MFDVFLSHNGQDKPAVAALAQRLRNEAKLKPFLDQWNLIPGCAWQPALEKALAQSLSAAIFIGPQGLGPWSCEELRLALSAAARTWDEYRVIPVLLPGACCESLTGFLAQRTWVDFRDGLDDAVAFKRLVAGIKGHAPEHDTYQLPDEPAPYRGLLPFTKSQAHFFCGREREVEAILDKLKQHPFLALVGASGVGKSSLVLGGVLPRLEHPDSGFGPHLRIRVMTPGSRPLRALADQLATLVPPDARLSTAEALARRFAASRDGFQTALATLTAEQPGPFVLVVDQFEELLTHGADLSTEAEAFISNLREAVDPAGGSLRVLVALRADFFGRCLEVPALRELLQEHQVLLGSLSKEALRNAIVCPAHKVGAILEKGLVGAILKDVSHEPGALPLLEHALYELWRARNGAWLTLSAYEATGGVAGALQRRAQSTYEALPPREQEIARGLFLRLMTLGEGTPDTRRRVSRDELIFPGARPEQVEHLLRVLSGPEARLLMVDGDSVEVTHEVLIREWDTLRNWVNTNRRELQVHRRLTDAANQWAEHQRDVSYLYTGSRLLEAEAFFTQERGSQAPETLNQREFDFLATSLAHRDEQRREATLRQQEELVRAQQLARAEAEKAWVARRAARRLGGLALVLILGSTGILGLLQVARHQQNVAFSRELTANALLYLKSDPQRSLALTQEASRFAMTEQVAEALEAWRREPGWMLLRAHEGAINASGLSPDGGTLATASEDGTARLWDLSTGRSQVLSGHTAPLTSVAFSPDGGRLVTASEDGTARLWDVATGQSLAVLSGHMAPVLSVAFSPDGGRVATADNEGTARLWDVATGRFRVLSAHLGPILSIGFSPDGGTLVTAGFDATARLWDLRTGRSRVFSGHVGSVWSARFSSDGRRLVTVGSDGTARLWDVATGRSRTLTGHTKTVWSARFSPDGGKLVTASEDGTARLWDLSTGEGSTVLFGHTAPVLSAEFSPDGRKLVTASEDGTARLWDVATGRSTALLSGHTAPVVSAGFSPDGTRVVSASLDGTARLWDVASSKFSTILAGHTAPVKSAEFSPDGGKLVTASEDGTARLWALTSGGGSTRLSGHTQPVWSAAFSPDGTKVVSTSLDGTMRLWDVATGSARIFSGHEGPVRAAGFSPDGTRIVTAGDDGTVRLWDVATGQFRVFSGHTRPVWSAEFSPDGTKLVTASDDGTARLWDVATGQSRLFMYDKPAWPRPVWSARFSPDGTKVVTAGNDGAVHLWDVDSGQEHVFVGHQKPVWSAEFSPDGTKIVTASDDGTARLWDVATGQSLAILSGHEGPVRSARFSPDGTKVVTASDDGTARPWDVDTGQSLAVLSGHEGPVRSARFSPDGASISTAGADGRARLWPDILWAPDEARLARLETGQGLTPDERRKSLHLRSALARSSPPGS